VAYAYTSIPSYPSGQIGFMLCHKGTVLDFAEPHREAPEGVCDVSLLDVRTDLARFQACATTIQRCTAPPSRCPSS